ncbi:MAG: protein translocase subunit SecD [Clostridia bacterium]
MSKKKSILILSLIGIFIILMAVFAVVSFPIGKTVYDYTGYVKTIKLGLDMSGGVSAVFRVEDDGLEDLDKRVEGTVASLQSLLVSKGYTEATVTTGTINDNGSITKTIRVEVPDVDDPERVLTLIGSPRTLEFKGEDKADAPNLIVGRDDLESAYVTTDQNGKYAVGLKFNKQGTEKFAKVTADYKGKDTFIYIDGEKYTTVKVNDVISDGKAIITSGTDGYKYDEAYDFATRLQAGTFGVKLITSEVHNISPTLGADAIKVALIAGIIGVLLIFVFMAFVYRFLGLAADIALAVYIVLLLWFCSMLPWVQLTLPGLAGILLSIGMAVDANVIIFERIKDEYRHTMKPIPSAIKSGFKRSFSAIFDGNVTTLIGAIVLWVIGSASVVGFAVTLFIGIMLSMFTALVITRLLLKCFVPLNSTSEKLYGLKRESEASKALRMEIENSNNDKLTVAKAEGDK